MSLHLLGVESIERPIRRLSRSGAVVSLAGLAAGALLWREHPVLGAFGGAALASNVHGLATRRLTWREAGTDLGRHVVATAGSLALPRHPAIGYMAAAIAAELLIDGEGGGLVERAAQHITGPRRVEVIDAEVVPSKKTTALAKAA